MKARAKTILRATLSTVLVLLVLWWVDFPRLVDTLGSASLAWVGIVVLLHTGDRLLMAYKWRRLLVARGANVSIGDAVRAYYVSSFAGVFLPMTVGADVVRVGAMRGSGPGTGTVIASIALERALGALSQAVFCALSLLLIGALQLDIAISLPGLGLAILAMLGGLTAMLPLSFKIARWVANRYERGAGAPAKLGALAREYADWATYPREIWVFLALTLLEGLFPIVTYAAAARAVGADVTLIEMTALVPIVYLVARLPVFFSGIGVEQTGFVAAASALTGVLPATAAAISFLVSPITLLIALLPGALAFVHTRRAR
jgi:uncharacterized membrane protein YbhN (UPF0104 family)